MRLFIIVMTLIIGFGCNTRHKKIDPVQFTKIVLDTAFRSEAVAPGDVNRDGKMDVMAGEVWYEAPDWKIHEVQTPGKYNYKGGYSETFGQFAFDANQDGWVDVIISNMESRPIRWFENPQNGHGHWKEHIGFRNTANETIVVGDLLGSGRFFTEKDLLCLICLFRSPATTGQDHS